MALSLHPPLDGSNADIPWEHHGGCLEDFDDDHRPETLPNSRTRILNYPQFFEKKPPQVLVYGDAFPSSLVHQAYQKTVDHPHPSWGDYVSLQSVQEHWNEAEENPGLSLSLVANYLRVLLGAQHQASLTKHITNTPDNELTPLWTRTDLSRIHGVAIWGLAASCGSEVPYHLDYAELLRYQHNIIVPPLLAGTLQCTEASMIGGEFEISLDGIPHYARHGYKAKKMAPADMIRIPYRFNQLTCHLGNLPHASRRVESMDSDKLRVIVGFNVFGHDVGPTVALAPEHSDTFRRQVRAQRILLQQPQDLTLAAIQKNKALSKLLVLAKRQRVKEDFQAAQEQWSNSILRCAPVSVQELVDELFDPAMIYTKVDIHVFINQQIRLGRYTAVLASSTASVLGENNNMFNRTGESSNKQLIPTTAVVHLVNSVQRDSRSEQ